MVPTIADDITAGLYEGCIDKRNWSLLSIQWREELSPQFPFYMQQLRMSVKEL
jgi:hypothetical protein